jgi:hypothetical protein
MVERDEMRTCVDSVTKNVVDVINKFEEQQERIREQVIAGLREEKEKLKEDYEAKLDLEKSTVHNLNREIELNETMLRKNSDEIEDLRRQLEVQAKELEEKHQEAIAEVQKELMLEHEVELDKAKDEWQREMEVKDQELKAMIIVKDQQIKDAIREQETLKAQFEVEKAKCLEAVREECNIAQELAVKECTEKALQDMEGLKSQHEEDCQKLRVELSEKCAAEDEAWQQKYSALETKLKEESERYERDREEWRREEDEPVVHLIEDDYLPMERHGEIVNQLKEALEEEKQVLIAQVSLEF